MWRIVRTLPRRALKSYSLRFSTQLNREWRAFSNKSKYEDYYDSIDSRFAEDLVDDDDEVRKEEEKRQEIKEELDARTGRGWSDPWDLEDDMNSTKTFDDLAEWAPNLVSRISQERVQIHPDKIPTLSTLARLALPPPPPPHPGHGHAKVYALHRKRVQYKYILERVTALAEPRIAAIQNLPTWEEKQDAVDELFENIEFELKDEEAVLGKHPHFGKWVERALEEYLRSVQKTKQDSDLGFLGSKGSDQQDVSSMGQSAAPNAQEKESSSSDASAGEESETKDAPVEVATEETDPFPTKDQDASAVPIFMDCFGESDSESDIVPGILSPLNPTPRGENQGRMLEEWSLTAHKTSKRIMLRQSIRQIAKALDESSQARIFVHGRQGVGKTATLASIVASARKSGYIVLYLPDGDRLCKLGFYIEPNAKRQGIFDLPVISEQVCQQFLASHGSDLKEFQVDKATLEQFFTEEQLEKVPESSGTGMPLEELLQFGAEKTVYSSMCYAAAVDVLMKQDEKPFLIVMDEVNCYFQPGHYFHGDYDAQVKKSIPYDQISLFKPALDAMAISALKEDDDEFEAKAPVFMKRGAVLAGTSESRGIARQYTDALTANAQSQASSADTDIPLHVCEVPRLSALEVEHMLANYEATGLGKLRLDRGDTVMNDQEVAFLRTVSSGVAQKLMDACIM